MDFNFNDFVVCTEPKLEEFGINVGDVLFIVGDGFVPLEEAYNFRKVYIVLPVKNDHIITTQKPWSVDPLAIKHVDPEEQTRLTKIFTQDFSPKDEGMGTAEAQ